MEPTIQKGEESLDADLSSDGELTESTPEQDPPQVEIESPIVEEQNNQPTGEAAEIVPDSEVEQTQDPLELQSLDDSNTLAQAGNRGEETQQQSNQVNATASTEQAGQPAAGDEGQTPEGSPIIDSESQTSQPDSAGTQLTTDFLPLPDNEEMPPAANPRKVALVLSGGGARGAFQVGAEMYARQVKGYQWDIIAGVSVGALNGAMLAMHRYARLLEIWDHLSNKQVYTGGFNLFSLIKILFGAKSFYGNEPLKKMMQVELEAGKILDDLHVGAVSLIDGEYVQFTKESLELSKAILASASIPVIWPPVDVSADHQAMVDGGVRNLTPVGDVLDLEPDELVIINCGNQNPPAVPNAAANVLSIGLRALDIMQNEIFINDMQQFLRINCLVKEAESSGSVLHHPKSGKPYKFYPYQVIEPDGELGEVLDFSQKSIQAALKMGVRRAREVLGRP